jgi:hypothetical protein
MTASSPRQLLLLCAGQVFTLFAAACGGLGPVARPPWVEDQSLHGRVTHALLDGLPPEQQADSGLSWTLADYEPEDALTLALK